MQMTSMMLMYQLRSLIQIAILIVALVLALNYPRFKGKGSLVAFLLLNAVSSGGYLGTTFLRFFNTTREMGLLFEALSGLLQLCSLVSWAFFLYYIYQLRPDLTDPDAPPPPPEDAPPRQRN